MNPRARRTSAAMLGSVLALGFLPLVAVSPAAHADVATTSYGKSLTYDCDVLVSYDGSPLLLENQRTKVDIAFTLPATLNPFDVIKPTTIGVKLTFPEVLRDAAVNLLGGVAVSGASTNAYLYTQDARGSRTAYEIDSLAAARSDIPQDSDVPWVVDATGLSPEVTLNNTNAEKVIAPERFTVGASIYKKDGSEQPVSVRCDTQLPDRTIATVKVGETTTVVPLFPARVKARTAGTFVVKVRGESTIPTSTNVQLLKGDTVLSDKFLNSKGEARLAYPAFGQLGKRELTLRFFGDAKHGLQEVPVRFTVVR